ncbi:hypothetical protein PCASD_17413 [Puccinia coronata f. sp. avenae]|uniref:Uncharacterized protein n=1 Tax=Puccinia coronata f. sp. avenae TaxID=200324 RepID=A0A2N5TX66_9BASI|nr:hypothetical protein PCASD_17413 [Puccinia coronata f. sp. avenae]
MEKRESGKTVANGTFTNSQPPNRESGIASGTASGSALPLPSKTRRSRHKYSSRSRPSID